MPVMAETLEEGRTKFEAENPVIVFLDLSLPDGVGFSIISDFKRKSQSTGVIRNSGECL